MSIHLLRIKFCKFQFLMGDPHRWYSEFRREHGRVKLIRVRRREWEWRRRLSQKGAVVLTRVDVARLAAAPASLNELWAVMWHVSRPKTHSSDVAPSSRRLGGHNGPTRRRWSGSVTPGSWERCLAPQATLNDELLWTMAGLKVKWHWPPAREAGWDLEIGAHQWCWGVVRGNVVDSRGTSGLAALWPSDDGASRKLVSFLAKRKTASSVSSWMFAEPTREFCFYHPCKGLSRVDLDMSDGEGFLCSVEMLTGKTSFTATG